MELLPEVEIEFTKQKEFLINWYTQRQIKNKAWMRMYEKEKMKILERLENVNLQATTDIAGAAFYKNDTVFLDPRYFSDPANKTMPAHEISHDAFPHNPNKIVTREELLKIIQENQGKNKDENITSLLMAIPDPDFLLPLLNKLP